MVKKTLLLTLGVVLLLPMLFIGGIISVFLKDIGYSIATIPIIIIAENLY